MPAYQLASGQQLLTLKIPVNLKLIGLPRYYQKNKLYFQVPSVLYSLSPLVL